MQSRVYETIQCLSVCPSVAHSSEFAVAAMDPVCTLAVLNPRVGHKMDVLFPRNILVVIVLGEHGDPCLFFLP